MKKAGRERKTFRLIINGCTIFKPLKSPKRRLVFFIVYIHTHRAHIPIFYFLIDPVARLFELQAKSIKEQCD
jgi:hypothetical protein